jgi:hypothetical protein
MRLRLGVVGVLEDVEDEEVDVGVDVELVDVIIGPASPLRVVEVEGVEVDMVVEDMEAVEVVVDMEEEEDMGDPSRMVVVLLMVEARLRAGTAGGKSPSSSSTLHQHSTPSLVLPGAFNSPCRSLFPRKQTNIKLFLQDSLSSILHSPTLNQVIAPAVLASTHFA